jgi:arylsulfatase A-like enzyme/tetratricopeptide (TPR) repeat protein
MHRISRAAAALALAAAAGALPACSERPAPGLVLVTIDTCRADRIGCYGARAPRTPAIDGLAERGVLFVDASAPAPLTLPSHCSILTGLYPDRHGVRDNGAESLPEEATTLAEILRAQGFRTGAFVSAFPLEKEFGANQGFDEFDDALTASSLGAVAQVPEDSDMAQRLFYEERLAGEVVDAAIPWLREARSGPSPWFLWVHFFDPHAVYRPPAHLAAEYGPASYEGEIAYVDEELVRLLAEIDRDATTVVVTADHGESLGEHAEVSHGLFVYQSSLRVPWVMAGPGIPAGVRVEEPVSLVQVTPTILDLLGVAAPTGLDGASARVLWDAGSPDAREAATGPVHAESLLPRLHYDWAGLRSVRRDRWKLVDAPRPELFDLESDPHETNDVAAQHPDVVRDLAAEIRRHGARGGRLAAERRQLDADAVARLESLGYVGAGSARAPGTIADEWNPDGRDPKDMVDFFNKFQEVPTILMDGRTEEAERVLGELHAEDPGNLAVVEKLALLHAMEENWSESRAWCEKVVAADPDDAQARRNLAFVLARLGEREASREEYGRAIVAEPDNPDAWLRLGALLSEDGFHERGIRALARAVELAPDDARTRAELARAWADSGDVPAALAEYDRALAIEPARSEAVNGKALLLSHEGRAREAVEVLRAALPGLAQDVETLNNLAWILANESIDPEEAYTHARAAERMDPDDPQVLDTLGWAAVRSGRAAEAVGPLTTAWEKTRDAEVRLHLGIALAEAGRGAEGSAHVRAAIEERPQLASVREVAKWR